MTTKTSMAAKLQKIIRFLKVIRVNNLLIIAYVQWMTVRFLTSSLFYEQTVLFYIILSSVLIALSGFLFNDFLDYRTDSANLKLNSYLWVKTSKKKFLFFLCIIAFFSLFFAWLVSSWLFLLQVFTLFFAFLYSVFIKKIIFLKNIYVSLLTAWAIGIFIFINDSYDPLILLFVFFAFWLNMMRETIKDMQDKKGDALSDISTIPVTLGDAFTWNYLSLLSVLLLVSEFLCMNYLWDFIIFRVYFSFAIMAPSVLLTFMLFRFRKKEEKLMLYNNLTKGLMVLGISSVVFL